MSNFFLENCWIWEIVMQHLFTHSHMYKVSALCQVLCWGLEPSSSHRYLSSFKEIQGWILFVLFVLPQNSCHSVVSLEERIEQQFPPTFSAVLTVSAGLLHLHFACFSLVGKQNVSLEWFPFFVFIRKTIFARYSFMSVSRNLPLNMTDCLPPKNSFSKNVLKDLELPCAPQ